MKKLHTSSSGHSGLVMKNQYSANVIQVRKLNLFMTKRYP